MLRSSDTCAPVGMRILEVDGGDTPLVLAAHALLEKVLGVGRVEDIASFRATVSPEARGVYVPKLACAAYGRSIQGVVLGVYLGRLNMGMILYAGVREAFRKLGVYSTLRAHVVALLNSAANGNGRLPYTEPSARMDYLVSEFDAGSELGRRYLREWGAFLAPCEYEQPAAQGLPPREMELVFQPIAAHSPPSRDQIAVAVREIYQRVYRMGEVGRNVQFRRVVESLHADAGSGQGAYTT